MSLYKAKTILLPAGLVIIAFFAARTGFSGPENDETTFNYGPAAEAVLSNFTANEGLADSAPQQQVVAGWAIKDLLAVVVEQADATNLEIIRSRSAATSEAAEQRSLLGLGVIALCWIGVWMPVRRDVSVPPLPPSAPTSMGPPPA